LSLCLGLQFGAALSVGIDVDPHAITSARQNAALNNIRPEEMQLHLIPGEACSPSMNERTYGVVEEQKSNGMGVVCGTEKYDVVIANILLNPLLDLADNIVSYAKHGAVIGLSGILSEQVSSQHR
jgi:ribosomal protein L11 methylase PrmA